MRGKQTVANVNILNQIRNREQILGKKNNSTKWHYKPYSSTEKEEITKSPDESKEASWRKEDLD